MAIGKNKPIRIPKKGKVIFGKDIIPLVQFYNAFMKAKIVSGTSNEVLISDLIILLKIKSGGGTSSGSSSYRGEYSPDGITPLNPGPFLPGDIVRVSPTNADSVPESGTIIPGVYVCILEGATEADLPNHPLSDGGETAFWQWLSTYPSVRQTCDETGETTSSFIDGQDDV